MPRSLVWGFVLLSGLALSGCDIGPLEDVSDASDVEPVVNCVSSSGSHAQREASDRQCLAAQTQAKVDRQQAMHDHGMSMPQPW